MHYVNKYLFRGVGVGLYLDFKVGGSQRNLENIECVKQKLSLCEH